MVADRFEGGLLILAALLAGAGSFLTLAAGSGGRRYSAWSYSPSASSTQYLGVPLVTGAAVALVVAALLLAGAGATHALIRAFGLLAAFLLASATAAVVMVGLYVHPDGDRGAGFFVILLAAVIAMGAGAVGAVAIAAAQHPPVGGAVAGFTTSPPPGPEPYPPHELLGAPTALVHPSVLTYSAPYPQQAPASQIAPPAAQFPPAPPSVFAPAAAQQPPATSSGTGQFAVPPPRSVPAPPWMPVPAPVSEAPTERVVAAARHAAAEPSPPGTPAETAASSPETTPPQPDTEQTGPAPESTTGSTPSATTAPTSGDTADDTPDGPFAGDGTMRKPPPPPG